MGPVRVYVGLGSNLSDPLYQLKQALGALRLIPRTTLLTQSRLYRSQPMGPAGQPDYLNAIVCLDTSLDAEALLDQLQAIELKQGRIRTGQRWGPRTLDLDLLLYGEYKIDTPRLQVPHPGLYVRNFVLYPLWDIAPDLVLPGQGTLAELIARCPNDGLEVIAE